MLREEAFAVHRTKNPAEAAFLVSRRFPIVNKEPIPGSRKYYIVFELTQELGQAVREFYSVDSEARRLFDAYGLVKEYLYDGGGPDK